MRRLLLALSIVALWFVAWEPPPVEAQTFPCTVGIQGPTVGQGCRPTCAVAGATPQTCNAPVGVVTTNSLTTAGVTAASYVINNNNIAATSVLSCDITGYSGTFITNGLPTLLSCVPGAGTITATLYNAHATNALAGTVTISFVIGN